MSLKREYRFKFMNLYLVNELESTAVILVDAVNVPSWSVGAPATWFLSHFDVVLTDCGPFLGIGYSSGPRPGTSH